MHERSIEPLIVTTDHGEHVDLTPLLEHFQAIKHSAMQTCEHGGGPRERFQSPRKSSPASRWAYNLPLVSSMAMPWETRSHVG